jgi:hypothetical protein
MIKKPKWATSLKSLDLKNLDYRVIVALLFFLAIISAILLFNPNNSRVSTIKSFPATVCPGNLSSGTSTSVLPSSNTLVRQIPAAKNSLAKAKTTFYLSSKPLLVDGSNETSINVSRNQTSSLATAICSINESDQWFVGGAGSVISKSSIQIVNSGLSTSVVDFFVYTPNTVSPVNSIRVAKNSSKQIYLDSLAPGESSVVIHAITRSGRVTMFLHDQRQRGLQSLGSDFVSQSASPAKRVVIPAINNVALSGRNATQMLRILAPGSVNANIRAKLIASDGTFAPIELDDINIKNGSVKDIIFKPVLDAKNFSLVLTSDQPIVAAVKSAGTFDGVNEFTWSTPSQQLQETVLHFGGLRPEVVFQGKNIEVNVEWTSRDRKVYSKTILGNKENDIATWSPKGGVISARFSTKNKEIYGGIIFKEKRGLSYLPLASGAQLESSAIPVLDARIISR